MKMAIDEIIVRPGRRKAGVYAVRELAESMKALGLLNPVTVSANRVLIAGLHRLEAAKSLGWTEIECNVSDLDETRAELAEIDENYVRCNLSAMEKADLVKRRKTLYESLYPETRAGAAQAAGMNRAKGNNVSCTVQPTRKSFLDDTSAKLGVHRCTVSRMVQISQNMTPKAREILKNTNAGNKTLLEISRMTPKEQEEVSTLLAEGKIKSVSEYQATQPKPQRKYEHSVPDLYTSFTLTAMAIRKRLETFNTPENQAAMSLVTPEDFEEMQEDAAAIHAALTDFIEQVKRAMPKESCGESQQKSAVSTETAGKGVEIET